jgi:hypothetical protein
LTIFDTFFAHIMRIFLVWILTGMSIVFAQSLAFAHEHSSHSQANIQSSSSNDTLDIRSGSASKMPSSTAATTTSPQPVLQNDSVSSSIPAAVETPRSPIKQLSRKEILKIPLEELLDLPMETVLEYAKVIDSMKITGTSSQRGRTTTKSKRVNSSSGRVPDTQILDKLNAALQQLQEQKQAGKKTAMQTNISREELLRMKLKDMLDMRLGEILKLVNPVLASSATSGAHKTPR